MSTDAITANLHLGGDNSSGVAGADGMHGNQWMEYFGPPNGEIKTNPHDKFKYAMYDLPEAYKGRNYFLGDRISGFILEDNQWYTSACLPYHYTDQIHFTWNEWHFNQTLAGIVPEEGVSRLVTSSKRQFQDHTIRHGIGFVLEHGFMNTAEGRQQYLLNIKGIQQCVQETNNYDVISALLRARRFDREWEKNHGMHFEAGGRVANMLRQRTVTEFATVQKDVNGMKVLHEEYKQRMARYGVQPNMWIFPPKLNLYVSMVKPDQEKSVYHYINQAGEKMQATGPSAMTSFRGLNVYQTREFDVFEDELPIDLLKKNVQVGEYNMMTDRHTTPSTYNSHSRSIQIYDESVDNWRTVTLEQAIENCVRFNKTGGLAGTPSTRSKGDVFTYEMMDGVDKDASGKGKYYHATYFGEMETSKLSRKAVENVARTFMNLLTEDDVKTLNSLSAGSGIKDGLKDKFERVFGDTDSNVLGDSDFISSKYSTLSFNNVSQQNTDNSKRQKSSSAKKTKRRKGDDTLSMMDDLLDIGAPSVSDTTVGTDVVNNNHAFSQHWDNVQNSSLSKPERIVARWFLGSKITKDRFRNMAAMDVAVPINFMLARPYMTYQMASAIMMKGGLETGATMVGHADFQLGDDIQSKVHMGNYTYYSKAIVKEPKNIIIAENIFSQGYMGGNDCKFITSANSRAHVGDKMDGEFESMYCFAIPATSSEIANPIDLSTEGILGHYHQMFYFDDNKIDESDPMEYYLFQQHRHQNTVCWQGHQFSWKESQNNHSAVTVNTGHWSSNVYPGCGRVRRGDNQYLKECNYIQDPM